MIELYYGDEITDDDLREFGISEENIKSCLQPQIDFALVCPIDYGCNTDDLADSNLWPIVRNLGHWVIPNCAEWKFMKFRGEYKFVVLIWH